MYITRAEYFYIDNLYFYYITASLFTQVMMSHKAILVVYGMKI